MSLDVQQYSVEEFFRKHFIRVPVFQRPYSWEEKQVEQLLDDLAHFVEHYFDQKDNQMYFLGTILLVGNRQNEDKWQVIDGQQRLATLTMIFAVLRDLVPGGREQRELEQFIFQEGLKLIDRPKKYRLILQDSSRFSSGSSELSDARFFQQYVQKSGSTKNLPKRDSLVYASHQRLWDSVQIITNRLEELQGNDAERLCKLITALLAHTYFVVIYSYDIESAFHIFAVTNDRGTRLTEKDLLKAKIIGEIADPKRAKYAEQWDQIDSELRIQFPNDDDPMNTCFKHIGTLATIQSDEANSSGVQKYRNIAECIIKEFWKKRGKWGAEFIEQVLVPHTHAYTCATKANLMRVANRSDMNEYTKECNKLVKWLLLIPKYQSSHDEWLPIVIKCFLMWGVKSSSVQAPLDHGKVCQLLSALERRALYFFALGKFKRTREKHYQRILQLLDAESALTDLMSETDLSVGEKNELLERLCSPDFYHKSYARYVLLRLDEAISDTAVTFDLSERVITIEHVLPQNPSSSWQQAFPNVQEQKALTHCLGNLVLLPFNKNVKASNLPYRQKCDKYFFAKDDEVVTFATATSIRRYEDWTPDVVRERQDYFLGIAKKIWNLF